MFHKSNDPAHQKQEKINYVITVIDIVVGSPVFGTPAIMDIPPKRIIRIVAGEIEKIVDAAERALIDSNRGLFQRDGLIVAVGEVNAITAAKTEVPIQRNLRTRRACTHRRLNGRGDLPKIRRPDKDLG